MWKRELIDEEVDDNCTFVDVGELMWERELIDEKVDYNCTFVRKNKICTETRVQFLVTFHHVTLIMSNEKFQF